MDPLGTAIIYIWLKCFVREFLKIIILYLARDCMFANVQDGSGEDIGSWIFYRSLVPI